MSQTPTWVKTSSKKNIEEKKNINEENVEDILENNALKSYKDIQWLTNIVEPEQQRGPSENP